MHQHRTAHALLDVECATLLHINCFKTGTASKCIFSYLFERVRKRDLLDSTELKAFFSNRLHAIWDFDTFKIITFVKCPALDPFQFGRKQNALYRTVIESTFSYFIQSLVQLHTPQLRTQAKRHSFYFLHTCWENNFSEATLRKASYADLFEVRGEPNAFQTCALVKCAVFNTFESFWEVNFRKTAAAIERVFPDSFQLASLFEHNFFQVLAAVKRVITDFLDAHRNQYPFYPRATETSRLNLLQSASFCECYLLQTLAAAERFLPDFPHACWNSHVLDLSVLEPLLSDFLEPPRNRHVLLFSEIAKLDLNRFRLHWDYFHVTFHVPPDVERAAILNPDCFETLTVFKYVLAYLFKRIGKRDFFDPTVPETLLSDIFYAALDFNSLEILTVIECIFFKSPQCGRKCNDLYLAVLEPPLSDLLNPLRNHNIFL